MEHQNLVAGEWSPSEAEGRFTVRAADEPGRTLGTWPRSGPTELARVLAAWRHAGDPEAERTPEVLERAAAAIEEDEEGAALLAACLGLTHEEWAGHRRCLTRGPHQSPGGPPGIALLVPHWSGLLASVWSDVVMELLRGRRVLLCSDPHLPAVGDVIVRALLAAGLSADRIALLHGAGVELFDEALAAPGVVAVAGSGTTERVARLRRGATRHATPEQRLEVPRCSARELAPEEDVERAAREVVAEAFGRGATLSGQLAGQLARVFCPERTFSAFTAALLQALETSPDVAHPLPFVSEGAHRSARAARALGLDEGATQIFGGDHRDSDRPGRVNAAVFTNVEPYMESARRQEPAPVLCLLRC